MGIELFAGCHGFHGRTDGANAFGGEVLEGDFAVIAVEVDTTIGCCVAVSRQCVVGTAGIVACTFASVVAEEHAAGIDDLLAQGLIVVGGYDEMLRCIGIAQVDGCLLGVDHHKRGVLQRLGSDVLAWQL